MNRSNVETGETDRGVCIRGVLIKEVTVMSKGQSKQNQYVLI